MSDTTPKPEAQAVPEPTPQEEPQRRGQTVSFDPSAASGGTGDRAGFGHTQHS